MLAPSEEKVSFENLTTALWENICLTWGIHPYPCPDCRTKSLERGTMICWECGKDRSE